MRAFFLVCLILAVAAADEPVVGRYRATNGITVVIAADKGSFQLVWLSPSGEKTTFPAKWTVPGQKLEWVDKNNAHHVSTVTEPGVIRDVGEAFPDSPAYWRRIRP